MSSLCFETTNVKNKSIVRLLSGFAFKNNFTFTKTQQLGWEEIESVVICDCCFILPVSIGLLYLPLSGIYSKVK